MTSDCVWQWYQINRQPGRHRDTQWIRQKRIPNYLRSWRKRLRTSINGVTANCLEHVYLRTADQAKIIFYLAGQDDSWCSRQVRGANPDIAWENPDWWWLAMKRTPCVNSVTRELTDRELNRMATAMGEAVRSQSLQIKNIILENLKSEFASHQELSPIKWTRYNQFRQFPSNNRLICLSKSDLNNHIWIFGRWTV